jgi:predicted glycosyltransferase
MLTSKGATRQNLQTRLKIFIKLPSQNQESTNLKGKFPKKKYV